MLYVGGHFCLTDLPALSWSATPVQPAYQSMYVHISWQSSCLPLISVCALGGNCAARTCLHCRGAPRRYPALHLCLFMSRSQRNYYTVGSVIVQCRCNSTSGGTSASRTCPRSLGAPRRYPALHLCERLYQLMFLSQRKYYTIGSYVDASRTCLHCRGAPRRCNPRPEGRITKPETRNTKHETRNTKPGTRKAGLLGPALLCSYQPFVFRVSYCGFRVPGTRKTKDYHIT